MKKNKKTRWQKFKYKLNRKYSFLLFLAPFIILYGIFRVAPLFYSLVLGFHRWRGLGPWEFVGFENYINFFRHPTTLQATYNTIIMGGASLLISIPLALFLALLLNSKNLRYKALFRVSFFLPRVVAIAVTAIMFYSMLQTDYGVVNYILGINPSWWTHKTWSRIAITFIRVWLMFPFMMVYFLAGLQNIPLEVIESAKVDGANKIQIIFKIIIPLLNPVLVFVIITGSVVAVQIFTLPYMLTGGGPSNATLSIIQLMYQRGISEMRFGIGASISTILFLALSILAYLEFKIGNKGYF